MKTILEYVWLDGHNPTQNMRSKIKVLDYEIFDISEIPKWSFDGSSTKQASGSSSDCILNPVRCYSQDGVNDYFIVLCEVMNSDGTPHESNFRHLLNDDKDIWFGFEQEYVILNDQKYPLGFDSNGFAKKQGEYYCGIGYQNVKGREIAETHLKECLKYGLDITGINAEVLIGQWEYQIFAKGCKRASDDLIISRYLLIKLSELYNYEITFHPKPLIGDWNGSGMHVNFSNKKMRNDGNEDYFIKICERFGEVHKEHIEVYGEDNNMRLTGNHETQDINKFSYGVSDRGASIRIPIDVSKTWKGYLEDRRPASNSNPYLVTNVIYKTLNSVNH